MDYFNHLAFDLEMSGLESNGNEGVLHIPQDILNSSLIIRCSFMPYQDTLYLLNDLRIYTEIFNPQMEP